MKRFKSIFCYLLLSAIFISSVGIDAVAQGVISKDSMEKVQDQQDAAEAESAVRTLFGILKPKSQRESKGRKLATLYNEGVQLERQGKMRDALGKYDKALKIDYTDPRLHMAVGRIVEPSDPALAMFHYQNAFRFAIEASAKEVPAIEIMRRFLVGRYLQYALPIEDPLVSTKLLELAQSLAPEDPRIHAHLASSYFFQGMYGRSIQENSNAMALGLDDGVILTNMAAAFAQLGREKESEAALIGALNRDERDINEVLNVVRQANTSEHLITFDKLLGKEKVAELLANSTKGQLESALKAWQEGEKDKGLAMVRAATEANPTHSYSLIMLGDLLRSSGKANEAIAAYKDALARNPGNELALPRLGDLSYDLGNFEAAANFYIDAMDRLDGRLEKIDILDRTAVALAKNKKHKKALNLLDKWLSANPNAPEAFELTMRRAGILADASQTREAELLLRGLIARDETNPASYIALYTFYKERKNVKRARQVINDGIIRLEAASEKDPLEPSYYRDQARLYAAVDKRDAARKALWQGGLRTPEKRYFSNALFGDDAQDMAYDVLKAWVREEPLNAEAILSYAWVAADLEKDLELASAKIEVLARENPDADQTPIRRTRSFLNFSMKNYQDAINDIRIFLVSNDVPQAHFFHRIWGLSAQALGSNSDALDHLKIAVELSPEENADLNTRIDLLKASL
ncbi:MAG: tetratricopeptide repeat protein [Candidatus Lindowbacteria bacterium]|nr:tetratricopeptide repeat protein [Candidatus Lindowbacteria bacterium]